MRDDDQLRELFVQLINLICFMIGIMQKLSFKSFKRFKDLKLVQNLSGIRKRTVRRLCIDTF